MKFILGKTPLRIKPDIPWSSSWLRDTFRTTAAVAHRFPSHSDYISLRRIRRKSEAAFDCKIPVGLPLLAALPPFSVKINSVVEQVKHHFFSASQIYNNRMSGLAVHNNKSITQQSRQFLGKIQNELFSNRS